MLGRVDPLGPSPCAAAFRAASRPSLPLAITLGRQTVVLKSGARTLEVGLPAPWGRTWPDPAEALVQSVASPARGGRQSHIHTQHCWR